MSKKIITTLAGLTLTFLMLVFTSGTGANIQTLKFYHTHTGNKFQIEYFSNGEYGPDSLQDLNVFLADFRNNTRIDMDPKLLDILYSIQQKTGSKGTFEVISAYRSPETNEMLRSRSNGVARNSQHVLGKAIDVRLTDVDTKSLREVALALQAGGVGYYHKSDFVHIDTGRVRHW
jgi:uncharacterized protein YcbK (DUF882 family)